MASISFVSGTVIPSSWLNDINTTTYTSVPALTTRVTALEAGTGLANGSVTAAKLAAGAAVSNIGTGGITANELATGAVTATKLAAGAAVSNIGANGITANELASNSVTTVKLINTSVTPAKLSQPLTLGTAVNTTSGTAIDFLSIPSWAKRITVMFNGVSTSGTSIPQIQLGTSSGVEATGYAASSMFYYLGNGVQASTTGFPLDAAGNITASVARSGSIVLTLLGSNLWVLSGNLAVDGGLVISCAGRKTTAATVDRIRLTTVGGTDTFDAGSINILYE